MHSPPVERIWPKVILFGDSITQFGFSDQGCWASLISNEFQRRCDVVARGFSGYNTRWCLKLMPYLFNQNNTKDAAAFVVFLGANDASLPINKQQHVPIEEYKANLTAIVNYVVNLGVDSSKIVVVTPPPIHEDSWAKFCVQNGFTLNRLLSSSTEYAAVALEVAKTTSCKSVDLNSSVLAQDSWETYLFDGLHLGEKGSRHLFSLLQPVLAQLTSHIPPNMFPIWSDVDPNDPEKSFQQWTEKTGSS